MLDGTKLDVVRLYLKLKGEFKMKNKVIAALLLITAFAEASYAASKQEIANSINETIFSKDSQKIHYVKDALSTDMTSGGIFISDINRLNQLNLICVSTQSVYERFTFFRPETEKAKLKKLLKFLKSNVDSEYYNKSDFKKIKAPNSASLESVNCGSDASKHVLGLNYRDNDNKFFRIEFSLDGFN